MMRAVLAERFNLAVHKLEPSRTTANVVIVDRIEKPTEN